MRIGLSASPGSDSSFFAFFFAFGFSFFSRGSTSPPSSGRSAVGVNSRGGVRRVSLSDFFFSSFSSGKSFFSRSLRSPPRGA